MCRWFDSAPGHQEQCQTQRQAFAAWRFCFSNSLGCAWSIAGFDPHASNTPENGVLSMEEEAPRVIIIAGPNGAGKTTFAREFLPGEAACPVFVNADLIAAGLAPFAPEAAALQAGRLMLQELQRHFAARTSFAYETTLSGRGYLRMIRQWQAAGYRVKLIFLQLASAEEAIARVAQRVHQGGHDIPAVVIRCRFDAGKANFERLYAPLVDARFCIIIRTPCRCSLTGPKNHEQESHRSSQRPGPATLSTSHGTCRAACPRFSEVDRHRHCHQSKWCH